MRRGVIEWCHQGLGIHRVYVTSASSACKEITALMFCIFQQAKNHSSTIPPKHADPNSGRQSSKVDKLSFILRDEKSTRNHQCCALRVLYGRCSYYTTYRQAADSDMTFTARVCYFYVWL